MKDSRQDVVRFWFEETAPVQWFQINPAFDNSIRERFADAYHMACAGYCNTWAQDADGALALILLFDQFSRNMFRGTPEAYATDARARTIAAAALETGFDQIHPPHRRRFFYLPFEHSENIDDQYRSVSLFATLREDDPLSYEYALRHLQTIERFGRFPHRNAILGRVNTPDEAKFLTENGKNG